MPSPLVIDEPRLAVAHHDVARLEIPVEEKIRRRLQQETAQRVEIVFELLLVEGNVRELEKVVFEVVQIPAHGAPVEVAVRIAETVVQPRPRLDLHPRQQAHGLHIDRGNGGGDFRRGAPFLLQHFEQGGVAEILLQIDAGGAVFGIDLRHGQARRPEVAGKADERGILILVAVFDSDGGAAVTRGQAEELAIRSVSPQFTDLYGRSAKVLGEEFCETGVHGSADPSSRLGPTDCYERRPPRSLQACSDAGSDSVCLVIASPAQLGVAIQPRPDRGSSQMDCFVALLASRAPRNDKLSQYRTLVGPWETLRLRPASSGSSEPCGSAYR